MVTIQEEKVMKSFAVKVKKMYDGSKDGVVNDVIVVVEAGKIKDVLKPSDHAKIGGYNAVLTDHSDKFMTPGLIDSHVHLMFPANGWRGEELLHNMTSGELHMVALKNALQSLKRGITTLRDCGSNASVSSSLKKYINEGNVLGPDLIISGMPITPTGGHVHYLGGEADGEHEIRKLIRTQYKKGIDFTKLIATWGGTNVAPKGNAFTIDEYKAAVSESHKLGLKITMHVISTDGIRAIVDTGLDGIEHALFLSPDLMKPEQNKELAQKIAEKGIICCSTICVWGETMAYLNRKPKSEWNKDEINEYDKLSSDEEMIVEDFRFQIKEGIKHISGSDAGWRYCRFGHSLIYQLELMSRGGMKNIDIIHATTALPAEHMGIHGRLGSIKPGLQADFLILDADPGENISNFSKLHSVYKKGHLVSELIL